MAVGIGPQIGFPFPVGDYQGYLNLKGYRDHEVENRPQGWSTWVTFVISPKARERHRRRSRSCGNTEVLTRGLPEILDEELIHDIQVGQLP